MDKLESEIRRGQEAERILTHELVQEARIHIDAELWRMFKDTPPQDRETLEFIKAMEYFHTKYWAFFNRAVADGKIAKASLEAKKKTLRERMFG